MDTNQTNQQQQGGQTISPSMKTVEEWRDLKGFGPKTADGKANLLNATKFAAAKGLYGWVAGFEINEADFDAAIEAGMNVQHGNGE